ncbi:MAG: rod shape-determining protein MreC, partial [Treponemataceae bacterium]|nr:rod shape-determining protein MreC [Treponemataceae bacterium]
VNLKDVGFSAFSTIHSGVNSVYRGITGGFKAVKELSELRKEYEILVDKLADYEYMQRENAEIRKENEILKQQLKISENLERKNIVASVIGKDPDSLYSAIIINKGSRNGIRKNMPVIAFQNSDIGLVGKVVTVGPFSSMIMPIYDYDCNVSARIQPTRDLGLISGQGSDVRTLQMKFIKKKVFDQLQYGDLVVTSGENGNYMKDVPIGNITNVKVVDYDSSLIIDIEPVIDFARLENVIVVDMKNLNEEE